MSYPDPERHVRRQNGRLEGDPATDTPTFGEEWAATLEAIAKADVEAPRRRRRAFFSIRRNRRLARMLREHGLHNARHVVRESARTDEPLADCAALMTLESSGANIFGCDHGFHAGPPWCHQDVTRARVEALERTSWPAGVFNGVGPGQLTSAGFVREADAIGGSWKPGRNMRVSFRTLRDLQHRLGEQAGANAYNGDPTGNYGRRFIAARSIWQSRINHLI